MSGPQHHFLPNLPNSQQTAMRNQFTGSPIPNQMAAGMQNQLGGQINSPLPGQINTQMMSPISNNMNTQLNQPMNTGNQMLNQLNPQYNMNAGGQMSMGQPQIQQTTMRK